MSKEDTSGFNAGRNGASLERLIESVQGFRPFRRLTNGERQTLAREGPSALDGSVPYLTTKVCIDGLNSIYGVPWNLDLYAYHPWHFPRGFALECKWQQVAGSADEKFVFSVLSLDRLKRDGLVVAALMLDAAGARACARGWVEQECRTRGIHFFTSGSQWAKWCRTTLK